MTLAAALQMRDDEVVALVGGGGKTTAMFRLAREMVDTGGSAITTTTTRIFGTQIALSPVHVLAADATASGSPPRWRPRGGVVIVATDPGSGKAEVSRSISSSACAPGARTLHVNEARLSHAALQGPAAYEPVIPVETTLVVPVVGADVLGQPLDADHVHRAESSAR